MKIELEFNIENNPFKTAWVYLVMLVQTYIIFPYKTWKNKREAAKLEKQLLEAKWKLIEARKANFKEAFGANPDKIRQVMLQGVDLSEDVEEEVPQNRGVQLIKMFERVNPHQRLSDSERVKSVAAFNSGRRGPFLYDPEAVEAHNEDKDLCDFQRNVETFNKFKHLENSKGQNELRKLEMVMKGEEIIKEVTKSRNLGLRNKPLRWDFTKQSQEDRIEEVYNHGSVSLFAEFEPKDKPTQGENPFLTIV